MTRDDLVRELEIAEQHVLDVRRRIADHDRYERLRASDSLTARVLVYMESVGAPLTVKKITAHMRRQDASLQCFTVHSSIKSLRLYGRVDRVGYGRYALRNVE